MQFFNELFHLNTDVCGGIVYTDALGKEHRKNLQWLKKTTELKTKGTHEVLFRVCSGSHILAAKFYALCVPRIIKFIQTRDRTREFRSSAFEVELNRFCNYCTERRLKELRGGKELAKNNRLKLAYDPRAAREAKLQKAKAKAAAAGAGAAAQQSAASASGSEAVGNTSGPGASTGLSSAPESSSGPGEGSKKNKKKKKSNKKK